jgi:dephospho-CoA kinase
MIVVGLTGNVASGKSTVARLWAGAGVPVVSADDLAREVVRPGSEGLARVVEAFGPEILDPAGALDRARMRDRVFRDPEARIRLEAILHPRIAELRDRWITEQRAAGAPLVVLEIPLLFEAGLTGSVDRIVLVDAPPEERIRRMVEDRGLSREEALRIVAAQMPSEEKRRRAHHVIDNEGTQEALEEAAATLLERLRRLDPLPAEP